LKNDTVVSVGGSVRFAEEVKNRSVARRAWHRYSDFEHDEARWLREGLRNVTAIYGAATQALDCRIKPIDKIGNLALKKRESPL
jgi:hypothetical protein